LCIILLLKIQRHGLIANINIASIDHEFREVSVKLHRRAIAASAALGAKLYIIHPGYSPGAYACGMHSCASTIRWQNLALCKEELCIRLAVENMPKSDWHFFKKPDLDLPGMGLVLDVGHAHTCGTLSELLSHPALAHIHQDDNSGKGDEHLGSRAGLH
jgi:sugar phosphate isomerase/epimerase